MIFGNNQTNFSLRANPAFSLQLSHKAGNGDNAGPAQQANDKLNSIYDQMQNQNNRIIETKPSADQFEYAGTQQVSQEDREASHDNLNTLTEDLSAEVEEESQSTYKNMVTNSNQVTFRIRP